MIEATATRMFAEAGESAAAVARQLAANRDQVAKLGERLRADPPHLSLIHI